MAKDNKFVEELQNSVEDGVVSKSKVMELQKEYIELEGKVIKTPEDQKRMNEIDKEISKIIKKDNIKKEVSEPEVPLKELSNIDIEKANYDALLSKREELRRALDEINTSVIKDPEKIKELEKELLEVQKAIAEKEDIQEDVEKTPKDREQEDDEIKEEIKDEENLNEEERNEKEAKEAALKEAYYNAMVKLHAIKEENALRIKESGELVNTDEEYLHEIKAEDEMYKARDAYMALGKSDPYTAERQSLREQEKRLQKENLDLLNKKTKKFRELEVELSRLEKARREKEEEIANATRDGATREVIDELNRDLREIDHKIKDTKAKIIDMKDNLAKAMTTLENRKRRRRELNLETREYEAQSREEKDNIKAAQNKEDKRTNDYKQANRLQDKSINKEVTENERRVKEIEKELKEVTEKEPENFEKRLSLLEQLDDANQKLKASRETKDDVEKGREPDTDEAIKKNEDNYKKSEERKEEFEKKSKALRQAVRKQEEQKGQKALQNPTMSEEEKKEDVEADTIALMAGASARTPEGAVIKMAVTKEIVKEAKKEVIIPPCSIPGVEKSVRDMDNPEDAEEFVKVCDKADKEAQKLRDDLSKNGEGRE